MSLSLKPEQLKEIAEQLDMGMRCFYQLSTGELECFSDPDTLGPFDTDDWDEIIDKMEANRGDYLRFDAMDSNESFSLMANFVDKMPEGEMRNSFLCVLQQRKPFREFKSLLQQYPDLLQQWYAYKGACYIAYVKQIAESYDSQL